MLRTMMKSKIHRATVTQADLHYVGSVTVDEDLLDAADLLAGELVVRGSSRARTTTPTSQASRASYRSARRVRPPPLTHPHPLHHRTCHWCPITHRRRGLLRTRRTCRS